MSRALHRRLKRLEQCQPDPGRWHQIMGHSDEELAAQEAELKASEVWREGDHIISTRIVSPEQGRVQRGGLMPDQDDGRKRGGSS
jgi:hypothetical protein